MNEYDLHNAVKAGNTAKVKYILDTSASNINLKDPTRLTPLHYASKAGHLEIVKLLLTYGADIDLQGRLQYSALHHAARHGHTDVARLLLTSGANPNLLDALGESPLHCAATSGSENIAKLLLDHGANVNLVDDMSDSPLSEAIHGCKTDTVKILLVHGANPNIADKNNQTIFSVACDKFTQNPEQAIEMVKLLVASIVKLECYNDQDINSPEFIQNKAYIKHLPQLKKFEDKCFQEVQKMKNIKIGNDGKNLFDVFLVGNDKNILARCISNPVIQNYTSEFCMYAPFIEKHIEEGKSRLSLLQNALKLIDEIFDDSPHEDGNFASSSQYWNKFPPEIKCKILENLSDKDLIKIQSFESQSTDLVGLSAIYE